MTGYLSVKMKRKDLEEVYDEFSEFSLSSPARKIRRLDADLPPIMEEEEYGMPQVIEQPSPEEYLACIKEQLTVPVTEVVPSLPLNEERALVLYKPVSAPLLQAPCSSNFSITVGSEWIPGLKNQFFYSSHQNPVKTVDQEEIHLEKNDHLALIPWVQSQFTPASEADVMVMEVTEPMEAEETGVASMETEDGDNNNSIWENGGREGSEGLQKWQQQHCMIPQLHQSTSTPITWSW